MPVAGSCAYQTKSPTTKTRFDSLSTCYTSPFCPLLHQSLPVFLILLHLLVPEVKVRISITPRGRGYVTQQLGHDFLETVESAHKA